MTLRGAVSDFMILAGFSGIVGGTWLVCEPAAIILAGALLLVAGLVGARGVKR